MMITMLTSGINLSIIASANLSGIVMAQIMVTLAPTDGGPALGVVLLALLAGLAVSALIGLLNGWLIAYLDMSPILATLGTMITVSGFAIVLTKGYVISGLPKEMLFIGNGMILGIPAPLLIFLACAGPAGAGAGAHAAGGAGLLVWLEPNCLFLFRSE